MKIFPAAKKKKLKILCAIKHGHHRAALAKYISDLGA